MTKTIWISLLLCAWNLCAQNTPLEKITSRDGLSQSMVFDLIQTRDGFLWFGTKDGLNRYDGHQFIAFKHDPFDYTSISGDIIFSLYEDSQNRIWAGTESRGINIFRRETLSFQRIQSTDDGFNLSDNTVMCIAEDPSGGIWAGTTWGYLIRIESAANGALRVSRVFLSTDSSRVETKALKMLSDGRLIAAGTGGAFSVDWRTGKSVPIPLKSLKEGGTLSAIYEDSLHRIWIGGSNSLALLDGKQTRYFDLPAGAGAVNSFAADQNGHVWVSAYDFAFRMTTDGDPEALHVEKKLSFEGDAVKSTKVLVDRSGIVWFGTTGYGILKYNPAKENFRHLASGISIWNITQDRQNRFWLRRAYHFRLYHPELDTIAEIPPGIPTWHLRVFSMIEDEAGRFWYLTEPQPGYTELWKYDPESGSKTVYHPDLKVNYYSSMIRRKDGTLWIGGLGGRLARFDPRSGQFTLYDYSRMLEDVKESLQTYSFMFSGDETWISTQHGLIRAKGLESGQPQYRIYRTDPSDRKSLSNNFVLSTLDDPQAPDRYLWVGTKGGGLNRLDKTTGEFIHFNLRDGLPDNVVYGILPAKNQDELWLSTNRGLSRFSIAGRKFTNFSVEDGLQDNEFNTNAYCRGPDGMLYFGGVNGISAFDPDNITLNPYSPGPVITQIRINNQEILPGDSTGLLRHSIEYTHRITLRYNQNLLNLHFVILDYTAPDKNQYRYRLKGAHSNWIEVGNQRSASFTDLKPGKYTFEVQGANSSGIWSDTTTSLQITVLPPWWATRIAWLIYSLMAAGLFLLIYRAHINRIKLRNRLDFETREAERLAELDQVKSRFFSGITHEFRTPLTLILEPVRQMLEEDREGRFRERLRMVAGNSERLLELVNQLLDLAKMESGQMKPDLREGDIQEVIRRVYQSFLPLAGKKDIRMSYRGPEQVPPFRFDRDIVEKAVTNLLSNAVKFTPEHGTIALRTIQMPGGLEIEVEDSGPGIPEAEQSRIFDRFYQSESATTRHAGGTGIGLALTRELIELVGGRIRVNSREGAGSAFTIWLPASANPAETRAEAVHSPVEPENDPQEEPLNYRRPTTPADQKTLILLVEDHPEMRRFVKSSMPDQFSVVEASTGDEGVAKARELIPDLIISDLMMPGKNGYELTAEIRNDERTSHIPIILLTAKSGLDNRIQGLREGVDAYLTKPFQTRELLAQIENLIEQRRRLQLKFNGNPAGRIEPDLFSRADNEFLRRLNLQLEANLEDSDYSIEQAARHMAMSRSQLHRKLKALTGDHFTDYFRNLRLDRSLVLLQNKEGNVTQVSIMVGFGNEKYFSTRFKERFGVSPSEV